MRPVSISLFCLFFGGLQFFYCLTAVHSIYIIYNFVDVPFLTVHTAKHITLVATLCTLIAHLLIILSLQGIWHMRKWGVCLFIAVMSLGVFASEAIGLPWSLNESQGVLLTLVMSVFFISLVLPKWRDLDLSY